VASVQECEAALQGLARQLAGVDAQTRRRHAMDRTVACTVTDLGVVWTGRLTGAGVEGLRRSDRADGQIRLTVGSDDLVALTDGRLGLASAWGSGRLRIDASLLDLVKLRTLL